VKENIISIGNGCMCCTVRDDLVKALNQLAKRRDQLDYVLVETTGLADPAPVCFTFQMNESISRWRKLINHDISIPDEMSPDMLPA